MRHEVLWNSAAIFGFLLLFLFCYRWFWWRDGLWLLGSFTVLDLLIVALATFRLSHLFTDDKVFGFVRDYFFDARAKEKPTHAAKRFIYELMECLWCTGMWSAVIVLTLYISGGVGSFFVFVLAIAGLGSFLQVCSKRLAP